MEESEVKYAGFWIRFVAFLIDSVLVVILIFPPLIGILFALYGSDYPEPLDFVEGELDSWLFRILPALAVIIFWIYKSATPGKMVLKTQIVDAKTGETPSKGQCIGRYFAYYLSLLPLGMGFAWIAFDKRKQGWHDKLAGTVVIYVKSQKDNVD